MKSPLITLGIIIFYYFMINLFSYILMGSDKRRAIKHRERTPEDSFVNLALLGGGVGVLMGRRRYRHKTSAKKRGIFLIWPLLTIVIHIGIWGLYHQPLFNKVEEIQLYVGDKLAPLRVEERFNALFQRWDYR